MLAEGRYWLDRVLRQDPHPGPERGKALWVNGYVATLQGDNARAVAMLQECCEYARRTGDEVALAYATHRLGCNLLVGDDVDTARALFEEAQTRYLRLGEMNSNVMLAHVEHAIACIFLGDLDRAAEQCAIARAIGEEHGERWAYAYAIYVQALVALQQGDLPRAVRYARQSLQIKRTFQDLLGMVLAIEALAWTAAAEGLPERAAVLLGAAHRIWPSVGFTMFGSRYFSAPHRACETAARQAIGDRAFDTAFQHATGFALDDALAYALADKPTHTAKTPTAAVPQPQPLTRREQEVAELIGIGKSNKEIAAALVISTRTAESHVERILNKLGFTSRTQIAAWITQQQWDRPNEP
ncbi:MAG: hypothetical protein AUI14_00880 [Actinobacteria bacterium 13_2_20CM_2_71_6]|nr:MAG: hypothetical protein AUI14_00880 [Actinobacteria bacterium 13_2_20CM_2_71_6]